jgi:hypothetical protein
MFEGLVSAFSPLEGDALFARTAKLAPDVTQDGRAACFAINTIRMC